MKTRYLPPEPTDNMIEGAYPLLASRPHDTPDRARRLVRAIYLEMWSLAPKPPSSGLTRRQKQVQEFFAQYISDNKRSPTFQEIGDHIGTGSRMDGFEIVEALIRKDVVRRKVSNSPRGIELMIYPGETLPRKKGRRK